MYVKNIMVEVLVCNRSKSHFNGMLNFRLQEEIGCDVIIWCTAVSTTLRERNKISKLNISKYFIIFYY